MMTGRLGRNGDRNAGCGIDCRTHANNNNFYLLERTKIIINDQILEQVSHFNYLVNDIGYDYYKIDRLAIMIVMLS